MGYFLDIAHTGLVAVLLHPLRSVACVAALVAVLLPYLVGLGLAEGVEDEAEASARFGADLYVTGSQFGRPVPLPLEAADRLRRIDGVTKVVPRIVGEVVLGKDRVHAVLVGLPPEQFPAWGGCVEGNLPRPGAPNELVVGTSLARRLNLKVGRRAAALLSQRPGRSALPRGGGLQAGRPPVAGQPDPDLVRHGGGGVRPAGPGHRPARLVPAGVPGRGQPGRRARPFLRRRRKAAA